MSCVQTIAVVPVIPHGVVQLGSLHKAYLRQAEDLAILRLLIAEDLKLVDHIRNVFCNLQDSLAGVRYMYKSFTSSFQHCVAKLKGPRMRWILVSVDFTAWSIGTFFPETKMIASGRQKILVQRWPEISQGIGSCSLLMENPDMHLLDAVVAKASHKGDEHRKHSEFGSFSFDRDTSCSFNSVTYGMLCKECDQFLEIAEAIRSFGLSILKGVSEAYGNKLGCALWLRLFMNKLVKEGSQTGRDSLSFSPDRNPNHLQLSSNNRSMHRMDVLWSLMQLLQPKISN
ncbi:hypothetical protein SASPL_135273 [Salvia splendens]|uniref:Uncharacterized protein n=1 Tax=Salvia splendens TaxID=180675 RepID=A0A8X8WXV8_SALSN|nr:hypothetical protein SASPL_135273 [Salvia splendens]